jgi:hypothetical protein
MTTVAVTGLKLNPMKLLLASVLALFVFLTASARAASDADDRLSEAESRVAQAILDLQ